MEYVFAGIIGWLIGNTIVAIIFFMWYFKEKKVED